MSNKKDIDNIDFVKSNDKFYDESDMDDYNWQSRIINILKNIPPDKFEKLCQRLLRELSLINVEVTGKYHDG